MVGRKDGVFVTSNPTSRRRVPPPEMAIEADMIAVASDGEEVSDAEQSSQRLRIPSVKSRENQEM